MADLIQPYAVGKQVYLRPLDTDDVDDLVHWINDPDITQTLNVRWPMSRLQEAAFLETLYTSQKDMTLGIALRDDNRLIGCIGLHSIDAIHRKAVFGLFVGEREEWGKGYATEASQLMIDVAFGRLNLNRLELEVYDYNPGARHIYDKLGFQVEGVKRQVVYWQGEYRDAHLMSMLFAEWQARR